MSGKVFAEGSLEGISKKLTIPVILRKRSDRRISRGRPNAPSRVTKCCYLFPKLYLGTQLLSPSSAWAPLSPLLPTVHRAARGRQNDRPGSGISFWNYPRPKATVCLTATWPAPPWRWVPLCSSTLTLTAPPTSSPGGRPNASPVAPGSGSPRSRPSSPPPPPCPVAWPNCKGRISGSRRL